MPKPRSLSDIKSKLLRPALSSHFEVEIGIPAALGNILGVQQDKLNLMCSEATLPGSQLTTLELNNDRTGVTEKHAYRRMFDDRIDLTFYVDAESYLPIRFFEMWMRYIVNEDAADQNPDAKNYFYRIRYPDEYMSDQGLIVRKFERDYSSELTYQFIRSFPLSVSSMPVSYESSSLLKCTVSMSYIRYIVQNLPLRVPEQPRTPLDQAKFNAGENFQTGVQSELSGTGLLSTGGISQRIANASGNSVLEGDEIIGAINVNQRPIEAGLPYVGRNIGPLAP